MRSLSCSTSRSDISPSSRGSTALTRGLLAVDGVGSLIHRRTEVSMTQRRTYSVSLHATGSMRRADPPGMNWLADLMVDKPVRKWSENGRSGEPVWPRTIDQAIRLNRSSWQLFEIPYCSWTTKRQPWESAITTEASYYRTFLKLTWRGTRFVCSGQLGPFRQEPVPQQLFIANLSGVQDGKAEKHEIAFLRCSVTCHWPWQSAPVDRPPEPDKFPVLKP
jgi:hypothetical protein